MVIYADSILFVVLSAVVSLGIGANISLEVCLFADFLCLAAYLSTKVSNLGCWTCYLRVLLTHGLVGASDISQALIQGHRTNVMGRASTTF